MLATVLTPAYAGVSPPVVWAVVQSSQHKERTQARRVQKVPTGKSNHNMDNACESLLQLHEMDVQPWLRARTSQPRWPPLALSRACQSSEANPWALASQMGM